ncbi:MAG: nucleotidyltransferase domain-containing protein [Bacillota bacterium]|nr:nucleotidyltransferase domain-containing protein [Bacillota bacterium]
MARTETEVRNLIEQYVSFLSKTIRVKKVILYGSYANGTATEDSDIDIGIESPDFGDNYVEEWQRLYRSVWRSGVEPIIEPRPLHPKIKSFFNEEITQESYL